MISPILFGAFAASCLQRTCGVGHISFCRGSASECPLWIDDSESLLVQVNSGLNVKPSSLQYCTTKSKTGRGVWVRNCECQWTVTGSNDEQGSCK
ncbi:hypothetical protein EDB83DRAFT_2393584 [Lactarius deliciosus]|nr:hypothetical protein EDB83DRAFT_2393584 [Lactarius deliciosus]